MRLSKCAKNSEHYVPELNIANSSVGCADGIGHTGEGVFGQRTKPGNSVPASQERFAELWLANEAQAHGLTNYDAAYLALALRFKFTLSNIGL